MRRTAWMVLVVCSACSETAPARFTDAGARARGRALYTQHCVLCHGPNADGHGERQQFLSSAPTDFTRVTWRATMTPARAFQRIRHGVPNTPMPAWAIFTDDETWDLAAYVLSVARQGP